MFLSKKASFLAISALVFAVSAMADETTATSSTERVSTELARTGKKIQKIKMGFLNTTLEIPVSGTFKIAADATTVVTVKDLVYNSTANKLDFRFSVTVACSKWDVSLNVMGVSSPWDISQCVTFQGAQERSISIDLSEDKAVRKTEVQAYVLSALIDEAGTDPDGFELETPAANEAEAISPGTKQAFKDSVRNMAYNNDARKEHIANLIADHVIAVSKADQENTLLP